MAAGLRLTSEERAMLAGDAGPGVQKAMEIVVALGRIYGAADLVPVASVQVSGVSYKNLGEAGLAFLESWAAQGAEARVPATLNPAGMDLRAWRELGFSASFARQQRRVVQAYADLGVMPTCTCTPYLVGHSPSLGQHIAWAESSAVSYANSILGARTNREGGPSALAAAITGRTARYGLHLAENRQPTDLVQVRCPVKDEADLGALGFMVGRALRNGVPYFQGLEPLPGGHGRTSGLAPWKTLGAAMAASGAVALYHVQGVTPEARAGQACVPSGRGLVVDDLGPGYEALNGPAERIDLVSLGCPHASLDEIRAVAGRLAGRRVVAQLWITTARATRDEAERAGLVDSIEEAGGRVVADTCLVVAPVHELGFRSLATNSAKMAFYAPAHSGLAVRFGPLEQCLEAALTGRWS
ncbi:MAG: aconitase X [Anaerolineae bacterium]